MPLMHCTKCHHEWESLSKDSHCDWCGAESYKLKEKTELEKLSENSMDIIKESKK